MKKCFSFLVFMCCMRLATATEVQVNVLIPSDSGFPTDTVVLFEWTNPDNGAYGYDTLKRMSEDSHWWSATSDITTKKYMYSISAEKDDNRMYNADADDWKDTETASICVEVGAQINKAEFPFEKRYEHATGDVDCDVKDHLELISKAVAVGGKGFAEFTITPIKDTADLYLITLYESAESIYKEFIADSAYYKLETTNPNDITIIKWTVWPMSKTLVKHAMEFSSNQSFVIQAASTTGNQNANGNCFNGKYLINGHLYIRHDNTLFDATGTRAN